jgi:IPT/TIG domain/PASTA domain
MLVAAVMVAALSFCGAAGAANVIVGPSLGAGFVGEEEVCEEACSLVNLAVTQPGARVLSPVKGVILRWSVVGGITPGEYHLRIANRVGAGIFQFVSTGPGVQSSGTAGVQTFNLATPITIATAQAIGLELSAGASLGFAEKIGSVGLWEPTPTNGATGEFEFIGPEEVAGFNAEIQPAPTATALSVPSGPTAGGTAVTITGTDLEGATAVSFGSVPAAVTADSETQITAVAPASATAAAVPVSITTIAGTATGPSFTYVAPAPILKKAPVVKCVVPNLKGKTLTAAKKSLAKAHCKLGKVTKLAGATPKTGKVAKQGSKAGAKLAAGAKVAVTLKPAKAAGKKPKKYPREACAPTYPGIGRDKSER